MSGADYGLIIRYVTPLTIELTHLCSLVNQHCSSRAALQHLLQTVSSDTQPALMFLWRKYQCIATHQLISGPGARIHLEIDKPFHTGNELL